MAAVHAPRISPRTARTGAAFLAPSPAPRRTRPFATPAEAPQCAGLHADLPAVVIDLHAHVLPGLDDGPSTLADAVALVRAAEAAGISKIVATPHVSPRYPTEPAAIEHAARALRSALDADGVRVEIVAGAEVAIDRLDALTDADLAALHLGDGPWILLESPLGGGALGDIEPVVSALQAGGHRILLAHPERSPMFQRDPEQLDRLVSSGVLTSVTASAFCGSFGSRVQRSVVRLAREGLVHNVSSDMHDLRGRAPGIADPVRSAEPELPGLSASLPWLTERMPEAILAGTPIPAAPIIAGPPRREQPAGRLRSLLRRR